MLVYKYATKLLLRFGYEFDLYSDVQTWMVYGINENYDKIKLLYAYEIRLNKIYARLHGKLLNI